MRIGGFRARAAALAAVVALLAAPTGAAAESGRYAPESIEETYRQLGWLCMVRPLCPVTDEVRGVLKRAIAREPSAEYLLGLTLLTGDGLPRDEGAGIAWTVRAAEHGDSDAAREVARRIRNGASIEVDETKVFAALKPRADAGDAEAMRALGPMYIRGRGTKQDPPVGVDLMKQAADRGSSGAAADLAQLYLVGAPGLPPSRSEALKWLGVSAHQGNVDAMVRLGYMSMNRPADVPSSERDVAAGYCWLMRAALLDQPQAQEQLSMMLARGEKDDRGTVIPIDLVQADLWFRLAARSPYHDNSQVRAMIEPQMTSEQLGEAKRLVEGWHARTLQEIKGMPIALPAAANAPPRPCPTMP